MSNSSVYVLYRISNDGIDYVHDQLGIYTTFDEAAAAGYNYIHHYNFAELKREKFKKSSNNGAWWVIDAVRRTHFIINKQKLNERSWNSK